MCQNDSTSEPDLNKSIDVCARMVRKKPCPRMQKCKLIQTKSMKLQLVGDNMIEKIGGRRNNSIIHQSLTSGCFFPSCALHIHISSYALHMELVQLYRY